MKKKKNSIPESISGKIFLSCFLSIFFFVGLTVFCAMLSNLYTSCIPYFWDETPCQVISSKILEIKKSNDEFEIRYSYRYKNKDYTCRKFKISVDYQDAGELRQTLRSYPEGLKTQCYVNPDKPVEAVIYREIDWIYLLFLIIPMIFMGVGGGAVFFTWKGKNYVNSSRGMIAALKKQQKCDHIYLVKQKYPPL